MAHGLKCLPNIGACSPNGPSHLTTQTSLWKLCMVIHFEGEEGCCRVYNRIAPNLRSWCLLLLLYCVVIKSIDHTIHILASFLIHKDQFRTTAEVERRGGVILIRMALFLEMLIFFMFISSLAPAPLVEISNFFNPSLNLVYEVGKVYLNHWCSSSLMK